MARRRVFFSFHYARDIWRANVVRNSWLPCGDAESRTGSFFDASLWERTKRTGDDAVERLINDGLNGTSVTAVLIGAETATRSWVRYEIVRSFERGNGLLGVRIDCIRDQNQQACVAGPNPFADPVICTLTRANLANMYPVYDWNMQAGWNNFASWVEVAARQAGR